MEVLDEAFKGIQGTLDHMGGGTLGGGLPPSISLEGVGVSSISPVVVCCGFPPPPSPQRRRPLPFPPRKGKRKGKPKSVGGVGRKTRLLPEVWLEAWLLKTAYSPQTFSH